MLLSEQCYISEYMQYLKFCDRLTWAAAISNMRMDVVDLIRSHTCRRRYPTAWPEVPRP